MAANDYPLLVFPLAASVERDKLPPPIKHTHRPTPLRQGVRIGPKFQILQQAFDAQRLQLQQAAAGRDPELVIVFETVGAIDAFIRAVQRVPGLEWLLEAEEDMDPDDEFFDEVAPEKPLSGRMYLIGSNQQALEQVLGLWNRYQAEPDVPLPRGFAPWKHVFGQLKDVRYWNIHDRLGDDVLNYWRERIADGDARIRFEIEIWHFALSSKNDRARDEVTELVTSLGGRVLGRAVLDEIAYHGMLVEMPAASVEQLMNDRPADLAFSDRVMFFRPKGQSVAGPVEGDSHSLGRPLPESAPAGAPVVALLDGLPQQNHPLLRGRLTIDDPDGWEDGYGAADRVHGTSMASLIIWGDLDAGEVALPRPVYARPVMRPAPGVAHSPRPEITPDGVLLIDLMHRAVRRICEGDGDQPAAAPTVKVINISLGDDQRPFDRHLSPWARLIDWLAFKYRILFVVSAGNHVSPLTLPIPRETLSELASDEQRALATSALCANDDVRPLLSPAEAINALTIGAQHVDASEFGAVPRRYDIFTRSGVSPFSRIGTGFRRAIKPDLLFPGGRMLYSEDVMSPPDVTRMRALGNVVVPPGQRVAAPSTTASADATIYTRGTSNAAALASRGAALAYETVAQMRTEAMERLPEHFDAVLLKALLAHGAGWEEVFPQLSRAHPELARREDQRKRVTRWVGYGPVDLIRALTCTEQRATMLSVGELSKDQALVFKAPLPPSLAAKAINKRLTITLAWLSPINPAHQAYRRAKLWVTPPNNLELHRREGDWRQVQRGTLQHERLEGDTALAFVDGDQLICKVNCKADAGQLTDPIPFALCVSLEIAEGIDLPIYQEIRDRIRPRVAVTG